MQKFIQIVLCCALSVLLTACGGGGGASSIPAGSKQAIYISSSDCAADDLLDAEACEKIIDSAIAKHNANAPVYPSLRKCEASEGVYRCERSFDESYRPRLIAFLITASVIGKGTVDENGEEIIPAAPEGEPLYPSKSSNNGGFVSADGTDYLEKKLEVAFSRQAIAAFERFNDQRGTQAGLSGF